MTPAPRDRAPFSYRDVTVHPPLPGEMPVDLVGDVDSALDLVRVAKLDDQVIGAYRLQRTGETRFAIRAIAVYEDCRGRGIGRWLLGHAIGIAELKGGRVVDAPPRAHRLFEKAGFELVGSGFRLCLTPE